MSEELEELKAQRPSFKDTVARSDDGGQNIYFIDAQESFITSLLEYLEEADKGRIYQRSGVFDGANYVITQTSLQPLYVFPAITPKSNETSIPILSPLFNFLSSLMSLISAISLIPAYM